ncbi:peptidoglycan editing factor PgeF [Roseitranquillus sediminis]|uniref:peptidoglycan editing factor PgeF n=1 Tax=Roseitranquillus sediminis TaxID=2809051 RepID=UPI001D0C052A|nr:peptidoglycan editing factor PgeF [Roseitranquillus sediminis]MBM9594444.1 peptidoglycan editing factor PgeF [Roseitranquillus sediminis]
MTLEIITDPALSPFTHGFFTRKGGASSGVFYGLNCGHGSTDQTEIVRINRARAAAAMQVPPQSLIGVHQVHSAKVVTVNGAPVAPVRADALVTSTPGLALTVLTADCQPVLLAEARAGVVGAVHAGWRGALAGVLEATVEAMEELGASRGGISAVIGPTISQRSYEVGPELFAEVVANDPYHARFFAQGRGDRMQFDLPRYGLARLRTAGVGKASWTGHCTYSDETRFYSYRRSVHRREADYGRLISAIRI